MGRVNAVEGYGGMKDGSKYGLVKKVDPNLKGVGIG